MTGAPMSRPRRRRVSGWRSPALPGAVAAVVLAVLASGCSGVPDDGPVLTVAETTEASVLEQPDVRVDFSGPGEEQNPLALVRGFLAASSATAGDAVRAREFLALGPRAFWDPKRTVVLASDSVELATESARPDDRGADRVHVILRATSVGSLTRDGVFVAESGLVLQDFSLSRTPDGWRIDNPPVALLVDEEDFRRVYRPVDIFYQGMEARTLVADRRFVAGPRSSRADEVLRAMFEGPSEWIAPGVRPLPGGGVDVRQVTVVNGGATVVLTDAAARLGRSQRSALAAAIVWSLSGTALAGVRIEADGRPLVADAPDLMTEADWRAYRPANASSEVLYLVDGELLRNAEQAWASGPRVEAQPPLREAAVAVSGSRAVATTASGAAESLVLVEQSGRRTELLRAASLRSPTWGGDDDRVFVVRDGREVVRVSTRPGDESSTVPGASFTVPAEFGPVVGARVAPDGVRVALLVGDPGSLRLLTGVLAGAEPVGEVAGLREVSGLYGVRSVVWAGESELVAVAALGLLDDPGLVRVAVDGSTVDPVRTIGLPGPVTALAGHSAGSVVVVAGDSVMSLRDEDWSSLGAAPGASAVPVIPGA